MLAVTSQTFYLYRPIVALLCGVCCTIAVTFYFSLTITWLFLVAALLAAVLLLLRQQFFLTGICAGIVTMSININPPYQQTLTDCRYQAVIQHADYSRQRRGSALRLAATDIVCTVTDASAHSVTSTLHLSNQSIQYWDYDGRLRHLGGKQLHIHSRLQPVHSRLNPLTLDYERYLLGQGIRLAAKSLRVNAIQAANWDLPQLRHILAKSINENLSANNAAIILALVTGNRSKLSGEQRLHMQQTGTSHILAISGLHLALLGGLAWWLFQVLWALSPRLSDWLPPIQAGGIAALIVISGYAMLTGFNLPVQRAWLMFCLLIVSWLWLRMLALYSLLFAAVVILLLDPYAFLSVGFYYSFIATYIVLWCVQRDDSPLINIILMQLLINLALLPITWWAFGMVSLSAFFVNLLIIPWLGLWVLPWAMLACILTLIAAPLAQPLWFLLDLSTTAMWQVIELFQALPLTLRPDYRPLFGVVIIAVVSVLAALALRRCYYLSGMLLLLLPLSLEAPPTMIVADSRYTSALIHNGTDAIIINPGYHYKQRNDADKWQRYLQRHQLQLAAIVLQDSKLNHIAATASLLKSYPKTTVITLTKMDLPYQQQFCSPLNRANLQLQFSINTDGHCQAILTWYGQCIRLFPAANSGHNALLNASQLIWQSQQYNAQQLGAVSIEKTMHDWEISYQRQTAKLWRKGI